MQLGIFFVSLRIHKGSCGFLRTSTLSVSLQKRPFSVSPDHFSLQARSPKVARSPQRHEFGIIKGQPLARGRIKQLFFGIGRGRKPPRFREWRMQSPQQAERQISAISRPRARLRESSVKAESRGIQNVATEISLNVLAYNFKRVPSILGLEETRKAMRLLGAQALFALATGPNHGPERAPASPWLLSDGINFQKQTNLQSAPDSRGLPWSDHIASSDCRLAEFQLESRNASCGAMPQAV